MSGICLLGVFHEDFPLQPLEDIAMYIEYDLFSKQRQPYAFTVSVYCESRFVPFLGTPRNRELDAVFHER